MSTIARQTLYCAPDAKNVNIVLVSFSCCRCNNKHTKTITVSGCDKQRKSADSQAVILQRSQLISQQLPCGVLKPPLRQFLFPEEETNRPIVVITVDAGRCDRRSPSRAGFARQPKYRAPRAMARRQNQMSLPLALARPSPPSREAGRGMMSTGSPRLHQEARRSA